MPIANFDLELARSALTILGIIIGKAIFEKIPLGCFLNRTILRNICCERVRIDDTFSYDKDLYASWMWIYKKNEVEDLEKYFVEPNPYGQQEEIELIPDGKNIKLTRYNKIEYLIEA